MNRETERSFKKLRIKDKKNDKAINKKNRDLMIEKILSYSPMLSEGIEKYKDANTNFLLLIFVGILLNKFTLIALPCCLLSMFFTVKMFQFVKYKSVDTIVRRLAKDLSCKGIYDKGKVENMIEEFKNRYGEDVIEYKELVKMVGEYETFVTKIEYVLKNINVRDEKEETKVNTISENEICSDINVEHSFNDEAKSKEYMSMKLNDHHRGFNNRISMLCKNENGEIKKINRAIEFFGDKDDDDTNAVILKSRDKDNNKLTVYLYKKNSALQKNVL